MVFLMPKILELNTTADGSFATPAPWAGLIGTAAWP
jgi:hypothetical protein